MFNNLTRFDIFTVFRHIIKNDKTKNKIAKEKGYALIRVSDSEVKNISFINKLKKIYDEFK